MTSAGNEDRRKRHALIALAMVILALGAIAAATDHLLLGGLLCLAGANVGQRFARRSHPGLAPSRDDGVDQDLKRSGTIRRWRAAAWSSSMGGALGFLVLFSHVLHGTSQIVLLYTIFALGLVAIVAWGGLTSMTSKGPPW